MAMEIGSSVNFLNGFIPGVLATLAVGGVAAVFNRVSGRTRLEKSSDYIESNGKLQSAIDKAFERDPTLGSLIVEASDRVHVILRNPMGGFVKTAFDLKDQRQSHAWWKAQMELDSPYKVFDWADSPRCEPPEKGTEAYLKWREVDKRNKTWLSRNAFTRAARSVNAAMGQCIESLSGQVYDNASGLCHVAIKWTDEQFGQNHILVKSATDAETEVMTIMETIHGGVEHIPAERLLKAVIDDKKSQKKELPPRPVTPV